MSERRHIGLKIPAESYRQIEELAETLHISKSAVITQAVARWHHQEPLIQKKHKGNSNDGHSAGLHD